MNERDLSVEQYLNEVNKHLGALPDKDQVISELRAHVWDLANQLSIEKGLPVQDAFALAIQRMEEPGVLASKFMDEEEPVSTGPAWRAPVKTPEYRVDRGQFMLIGIVGIFSVAFVALIISLTTPTSSTLHLLLTFTVTLINGLLITGIFVMAFYYIDDRLFREQVDSIRRKFLKSRVEKKVTFWSAFGEHAGGLLGCIFITAVILFIMLIDVMDLLPLFNDNWYTAGFIATYVSLGATFVESLFKLLFGRIRATRLVSAGTNTVAAICSVILVLFYPFTISLALEVILPDAVVGIPGVLEGDLALKVIMGMIAIIQFLTAMYNMFKFGAWKPADRKSLV